MNTTFCWYGNEYKVTNGVFQHEGLKFFVREGQKGECDVGIVVNCLQRGGFSYWDFAPYVGKVVDIGAHIGGFTCAVAKTAAKVVSWEASSENYSILLQNVKANRITNIQCHWAAVGDGSPKLLGLSSGSTAGASIVVTEGRDVEEVPGAGLAEVLGDGEVEFVKMDCEGAEYELFLDCPRDLVRRMEKMVAEVHWHPKFRHQDFVDFIAGCGYSTEVRASRADSAKMVAFRRIGAP